MLYQVYEWNHAALGPMRAAAEMQRMFWKNPGNPLADSYLARSLTASLDLFERVTRRYVKPQFGISDVTVGGQDYDIDLQVVAEKPFCRLLHFRKAAPQGVAVPALPKLLIVAPMSGHFATLLRGTVKTMLAYADVYITDWTDARDVPVAAGSFDLDDYIDYVRALLNHIGPGTHVMAVCQPSVPVLAAAALMNEDSDPATPASMTLMGGPIDTRRSPTAVNSMAEERGIAWFKRNVITRVPLPNAGFMREVYPGFLQLTGFMTMNLDRHVSAHRELYWHLVEGDGQSADKHREFYDEYLSVMDLTAEFYLQTVARVFIDHDLPSGSFRHRGRLVKPDVITRTALMTVEGERDDISGMGQTQAAHDLCRSLPEAMRAHHLQLGVGHYGVFNGTRFEKETAPKIAQFISAHTPRA